MLIAGRLFGSSRSLADVHLGTGWLVVVLLLTFAAFWCACAANATVRAVLWVVPVMIVLGLANQFGEWGGRELTDLVISRFDLFANLKIANAVVSRFENSEFSTSSFSVCGRIHISHLSWCWSMSRHYSWR
jgi:hypothetical protein